MPDAILEIYASIECPYAYLAVYRLKQLWPEIEGGWSISWKALSLEYINRQSYSKSLYEAEYQLFQKIEPVYPGNCGSGRSGNGRALSGRRSKRWPAPKPRDPSRPSR